MVWQSVMNQWVYALLDSIWQFAFMWFLFVFGKQMLSKKYHVSFAFILVNAGLFWFIYQLVFSFSLSKIILQQPSAYGLTKWTKYYIPFSNWMLILATSFHLMMLTWYVSKLLFGFIKLSNIKRTSSSKDYWGIGAISNSIAQLLHLKKEFQLLYSTKISSPSMAGHFKPFLIFPMPMMNELTLEQIKLLLLHEYAHLLHKDFLLHLWMKLLECVFFFNPFFKKLAVAIEFEMECRTDAQVVHCSQKSREYIELLLQLARKEKQHPLLAKGFHGNGDTSMLLLRVKRIVGDRSNSFPAVPLKYWMWLLFSIGTSFCISYNKGISTQRMLAVKNESFNTIQHTIISKNLHSSAISNKALVKKEKGLLKKGGKPSNLHNQHDISSRISTSLNDIHQDLMSFRWILSNPFTTNEIQASFVSNPTDSIQTQSTRNKQLEEMVTDLMQRNSDLREYSNSMEKSTESYLRSFTYNLDEFRKKLEDFQSFVINQPNLAENSEKQVQEELQERIMNLNALLDHHKIAMEFWMKLSMQSLHNGKSKDVKKIVDL